MTDDYHKSADCWWFSLNAFLGTCWIERLVILHDDWVILSKTHRCSTKQLQDLSLLLFHYCKEIIQGDHWGLTVAVRGHLSRRQVCLQILQAQTWQWNGQWKMDWKVLQSIQKHQRWRVNVIYLFEVLKQGVSEELGCTILRSHTIQNSG